LNGTAILHTKIATGLNGQQKAKPKARVKRKSFKGLVPGNMASKKANFAQQRNEYR